MLRFVNSGSEATLMAMRAARAFTGRERVAKFEGNYHGQHRLVARRRRGGRAGARERAALGAGLRGNPALGGR